MTNGYLFILLILYLVQMVIFLMEGLFTGYLLIHTRLLHEIRRPPKQFSIAGIIHVALVSIHSVSWDSQRKTKMGPAGSEILFYFVLVGMALNILNVHCR